MNVVIILQVGIPYPNWKDIQVLLLFEIKKKEVFIESFELYIDVNYTFLLSKFIYF